MSYLRGRCRHLERTVLSQRPYVTMVYGGVSGEAVDAVVPCFRQASRGVAQEALGLGAGAERHGKTGVIPVVLQVLKWSFPPGRRRWL